MLKWWAHTNIYFFTILNTKVLLYYTAYLYTPPIITPHDKSFYIVPVPLLSPVFIVVVVTGIGTNSSSPGPFLLAQLQLHLFHLIKDIVIAFQVLHHQVKLL